MKTSELFPSKWLKADDIPEGQTLIATIQNVYTETFKQQGKDEVKPVVAFNNAKPLILKKVVADVIQSLYGDDTDDWAGKKVVLYSVEAMAYGELTRQIRAKSIVPQNGASAPASSPGGPPATARSAGITDSQKGLLVKEAVRVWGEADYKQKASDNFGLLRELTYEGAEEWITWLKNQKPFVAAAATQDNWDDDDPFADD